MAKRALFVATVGRFFGFERNDIKILQSMGYEVHCAANFSLSGEDDFRADGIVRHQVDFARSPLSRTNLTTYREIRELLREIPFDLVHCHTPMGGVIARVAARRYRKKGTKVIYTAHGFHFFKGAPLINWLFYYPVEWILAHWTDVLITINREDYRLARKHMHARSVEYIPGVGIDMDKFSQGEVSVEEKRRELGLSDGDIALLSVGELCERKNHEIVVRAIGRLRDPHVKYFICGTGVLREKLSRTIRELGLEGQVFLLGFRTDISELCQSCDIFVFPSIQEGLPVALMEAIACRCPVVCSQIRGNTDLVPDRDLLFDPHDAESVARCIRHAAGKDFSEATSRLYERLKEYDSGNVSDMMRAEYRQALGISPDSSGGGRSLIEKMAILGELGVDRPSYVLLSVGELNGNKNQETVIRALGEMPGDDVIYLIAGEGPLEDRLREVVRELGLEGRVFLLGFRTDVGRLYCLADVFAHVSLREGLGMAPLEAMANGLPLVSTYRGGMKDYTLDGVTGVCVKDPQSADEVRAAISSVLESHDIYCSVNRSISRMFRLERTASIMRRIYGNLA